MKLLIIEPESMILSGWLADRQARVSSMLSEIEVRRAVLRAGSQVSSAEIVFDGIDLLSIDDLVVAAASSLLPPSVRSLDAVHLATALSLGGDLDCFVTYDHRLAEAASQAGITVESPE